MNTFRKLWRAVSVVVMLSFVLSSCKVGRFIIYNFANITDYKKFPSRSLHNDSIKFNFPRSQKETFPKTLKLNGIYNQKGVQLYKGGPVDFDEYLQANSSVAFLVIHNDSIQYEKYFNGYDQTDLVASFSMAKSITSILIGCAVDEGLIKSVNESITNYLPEMKNNGLDKVTIRHLLQMTSGIKFNESYINPFGQAASYYYGRNLRKQVSKLKLERVPGEKFEYKSGGTELLGLVLERALKGRTLTQYLQEKLWKPLGMEYDASWSIDQKRNGLEKTFCCINARARDFAKIGRLYLNEGNWEGKQIVSANWVRESTTIGDGEAKFYKYQWWMIPSQKGVFFAEGILGQFIYVNPAKKLIIVRLGKKQGPSWPNVFTSIGNLYR